MKKSSSTEASSAIPDELEVTIIKKVKEQYSQEIKMKLPSETTFGCILQFMHEQGLLKSKNAIIRPSHNENFILGHERKIMECFNLIKLKFIVEENDPSKDKMLKTKMGNIQALRNEDSYIKDQKQKNNICGKEECTIM